jgi:catechol 2,3-dioxygenase-like lactoylglutathione lyase family enzyme
LCAYGTLVRAVQGVVMNVRSFSHVGVSTPDSDRCVAFYVDAFGFVEIARYSWDGGTAAADAGLGVDGTACDVVVLSAGNTYLEVLGFRSPQPRWLDAPPSPLRAGITHIGLQCSDARAAAAAALAAGGTRLDDGSATSLLVLDPDGNTVELHDWRGAASFDAAALTVNPPAVEGADPAPRHEPRRDTVQGFHHAGVCTPDLAESAEFYAAAGLTALPTAEWDADDLDVDASRRLVGPGRAAVVPVGNAYLEFIQPTARAVLPRPLDARIIEYGFNHLCFDVDDIGGLHPRLAAHGMTYFARWTAMPGGHAAMGYGLDPHRLPIELLEHRSRSSALWPGHLSVV